jgi:transposase
LDKCRRRAACPSGSHCACRHRARFVPAKTNEQLDLQALHRVWSRLVSERTAVINQIRGFLLERGIIVRQGHRFLRHLLPDILAKRTDVLSPRMVRLVSDLVGDWLQLDERIDRTVCPNACSLRDQ